MRGGGRGSFERRRRRDLREKGVMRGGQGTYETMRRRGVLRGGARGSFLI